MTDKLLITNCILGRKKCVPGLHFYNLFLKNILFICMCLWLLVRHVHADALRGHKRVSYSLKLELQMVVRCLIWVLGTELRSAAGTANAPNGQAVSPIPISTILIINWGAPLGQTWVGYLDQICAFDAQFQGLTSTCPILVTPKPSVIRLCPS